jgi:hypothetical protein
MTKTAWDAGALAAVAAFGLSKQASLGLKELLVGQPERYLSEARTGKLFTRKGLLAQSMDPRVKLGPKWLHGPLTGLNAAALYGLPLYSVYQGLAGPAHERGSAVGSTLGSLIGSTLGMPLGIVGATAGNILGSSLGESLGRTFNKKPETDPRDEAR